MKIKNHLSLATFIGRPLVNIILVLLGMSAAYFTTIGSIKIQLAEKAESVLVETLDKKLAAKL